MPIIDLVLNNPKLIALLVGTLGSGGVVGFLVRGLLRTSRSVVDERLRIATEKLAAALKTPSKDDDKAARAEQEFLRTVRAAIVGAAGKDPDCDK